MLWKIAKKSPSYLSQIPDQASKSPSVRFAFRLFRELTKAEDVPNVFISPSSVRLCLALAHELGSGETRQEMANALEVGGINAAQVTEEIHRLKVAHHSRDGADVVFANSLWLGMNAKIDADLAAWLREFYESEIRTLDFASHDALLTINAWVNARTRGKISGILECIPPLATLFALNAVYFKGMWARPFERELTRDQSFTNIARQKRYLPTMVQDGIYQYYEDKILQMAALPYEAGISMYVVLPSDKIDGRQFSQTVTAGSWESWLARAQRMQGNIHLPRFNVDYSNRLDAALKSLGMERAFDQRRAEFEKVRTDMPRVWINQVIHRALAEVNEEGTEAAATTAVTWFALSAECVKPPQFSMIVNRPFLLVIRDEMTKTILFLGWIGDPQGY